MGLDFDSSIRHQYRRLLFRRLWNRKASREGHFLGYGENFSRKYCHVCGNVRVCAAQLFRTALVRF